MQSYCSRIQESETVEMSITVSLNLTSGSSFSLQTTLSIFTSNDRKAKQGISQKVFFP